jgi:hypothetical protein
MKPGRIGLAVGRVALSLAATATLLATAPLPQAARSVLGGGRPRVSPMSRERPPEQKRRSRAYDRGERDSTQPAYSRPHTLEA